MLISSLENLLGHKVISYNYFLVFMEITEEGTLNVHLAFTSKNVQLSNFYTG